MFEHQPRKRAVDAIAEDSPPTSGRANSPSGEVVIPLRTLAPQYIREQHAQYVSYLDRAVADRRNRNIALTGRYGSGKSSILDAFLDGQIKKKKNTLRISINTLGPDDSEALTNRIQKELVKQLVYRAEPGEIRHSRFARKQDPNWWRTLRDAALVGGLVFGLLWMFRVRPDPEAFGSDRAGLSIVAFFALVVAAAWVIRWTIGNRLVSQFSTGGTSISFDKQPDSYFDEYLDEIVAFFDATEPEIVVFEDLDRFDDPQIFDSLRELNTLINMSAHWKKRKDPLRFVYAIKDSLFDKLGEEPQGKGRQLTTSSTPDQDSANEGARDGRTSEREKRDAAEATVERANRTKFFEIVIPVVPFLSHSNARDLLSAEMEEIGQKSGTRISRGLVDIVARHATDMRLLINIRNEFVVFAQRLLWIKEGDRAPGLTADTLFALVAYKNFHLADFEQLPRRGSALDKIEYMRRELVNKHIVRLRESRSDLLRGRHLQSEQETVSQRSGDRLNFLVQTMGQSIKAIIVNGSSYAADAVHTPAFWDSVSESSEMKLDLTSVPGNHRTVPRIKGDQLVELFPEAMNPSQWAQVDPELDAKLQDLDRRIAVLRGADFSTLIGWESRQSVESPFVGWVNSIMPSQLARDLVLNGHLTRYYAEYSTVFYGDFLGVDVANFFRNCVWPNEMNVQFAFETKEAVQNILEQAPDGFARSRSALNIEVVDHLLERERRTAGEVVSFLAEEPSDDRKTFLDAYLNDSSSRKQELVGLLAAHPWSGIFDHLASEGAIEDDETLTILIDAALVRANDADKYELGDEARALIAHRYEKLTAFTTDRGEEPADVAMRFIRRVGLTVPALQPLSAPLCARVVEAGVYKHTAENLRTALGLSSEQAVTLDRTIEDEGVWKRCREDIDGYLEAVDGDVPTDYTVLSPDVLTSVIQQQCEAWTSEQLGRILELAAPAAALFDISAVPTASWRAIAAARLIVPSAANLHEYVKVVGVDENLVKILFVKPDEPVQFADLDDIEAERVTALRICILNAHQVLESRQRVWIAQELDPETRLDPIDFTAIQPFEDDLLADLLNAELVPDSAETFRHFLAAGWIAVSKAFAVSSHAKDFVTPDLISGNVLELLHDPEVPGAVKEKVVSDIEAYAADGDHEVLREAASFAHRTQLQLPKRQVELVAPHVSDPDAVLWQLASWGGEFDGSDAIQILGLLGGAFGGFKGEPGYEFDLPVTTSIKAVLDRLKGQGFIELPRGGRRDRKKVKLIRL